MITPLYPQWLQTVHHDGSEKYVSVLCPALNDSLQIRLRTGEHAPIQKIYLRTFPDGEQMFTPMNPAKTESPVRWWEADMDINQPLVHYRFVIVADDGIWWYSAAEAFHYDPPDSTDFRILADYDSPDWVEAAVFYQIFPDRFANGDPTNDPQPDDYVYRGRRPQTFKWGEPLPKDMVHTTGFYGGDIQGIIQNLDYLEDLGITALYLNPVFTGYSSHKYDVLDYEHVDPHFGGNEALIQLRAALSKRDMRYILDVVPNHCGNRHPWFLAAQADINAPENAFFFFTKHPNQYESWLGHTSLVKLNYQSQELRQRIYEHEDSAFRRWITPPFSADGWRVDVGNMLARQGSFQMNEKILAGIRKAVKAARPDAYLMAENFFDASPQLQGQGWDAVMNYKGFTIPLWNWLRGITLEAVNFPEKITATIPYPTASLEAGWRYSLATIPWSVANRQYNVLDSHDTSRIRSQVNGNDALHRLAVIVMMTFPGVPGIYYGDEIGMEDEPGIRSRGCMIWDESRWNYDLLNFHKKLITLRRNSDILKRGGFQMLLVEDETFAYQREGKTAYVIVTAHRSEQPRPAGHIPVAHGGIPDGTRFVEFFSGQEAIVTDGQLPLPELEQGATLWQRV